MCRPAIIAIPCIAIINRPVNLWIVKEPSSTKHVKFGEKMM